MPQPSETRVDTHEVLDAQNGGYQAFVNTQPSTACPWRPGSAHDTALTRAWVRGWCAARTDARKAQAAF